MNEKQFYTAVLKIATENSKGKIRYRKDSYLVSAVSPTDVEKKVAEYMKSVDYEIVQIVVSKILDIIK